MKQYIYLSLLFTTIVFGQNPEIKTDLPSIIPPSPTVAALMKFEEVPVSNYTGIPDVSIPLFSSPTHSKNIGINIALKYHSGVGANDRASDVGLGWSLFAGGTISRTVRSLPDEILITSSLAEAKIGLYHTNGSIPANINNYYYFKQNIANSSQDYYQQNLSTQSTNIGNEFLWTAANTNKYDTEHDLWQFNFMGNSGRFYIKKNLSTNLLEIVPLDDYRVKIINNYGTTGNNPYVPISFTIYDEKGYKYIFDVVENSENKSASASTYYNENGYQFSDNIQADKPFKSSFHLSKIYDANNKLLVDFIFSTESFKESFSDFSFNRTNIDKYQMSNLNKCGDFPPLESTSTSLTIVDVKKIQVIDIVGYSKIYFNYIKGRLDDNINIKEQTAYLNSITIKDNNLRFIKKFNFEFSYSTVLNTRMILKRVKEYDENQQFILNSEFNYKQNQTNGKTIGKDYWGFFNLINPCELTTLDHKNTSIEFCTTDLLEKIKYSTGGYVKFEFEPNTYSYIGNQEIIDFEENQNNFYLANTSTLTFNNSIQKILPVSSVENRKVKFYPSIVLNEDPNQNTRTFSLLMKVNGVWTQVSTIDCPFYNGSCCIDYVLEKDKEYAVKRINTDFTYTGTDTMMIEYFSKNAAQKNYLYGGGNRVKNVKYFESDNVNNTTPSKVKNYNYTFFNNQNKSSGSLAFPKPIYEYADMFATNVSFNPYSSFACSENKLTFAYQNYTSSNNLVSSKTAGSDVGYKEVTVFETGLGKTEYIYSSPIDYPETNVPNGIPFIPTKNLDYKRGLITSEVIYNELSRKINETIFSYDFQNYLEHTGTRFRKPVGDCYTGSMFSNYDVYVSFLNNQQDCTFCRDNYAMMSDFLCGLPLDLYTPKIIPHPIFEAYGWAKLISKSSKSYFYPNGSSTPNIIQTSETYAYNPANKQISESTVTNSNGETLKTKYFYHTGNSIYSQNRIAEIESVETYRGAELLSKSKVNYSSTWQNNVSLLPQTIATAKGANAFENRVEYIQYDEFSNPLEVQQPSGIPITYIWGYNKTQPIAKIENATYTQVQSYEANLQSLSNGTNEASLITALDNLRIALPNAMVTTYTYKPLIGISTVTDPKGDKMTYHYDSFNRLQFVKDKNGNILSENEYHYKN